VRPESAKKDRKGERGYFFKVLEKGLGKYLKVLCPKAKTMLQPGKKWPKVWKRTKQGKDRLPVEN